MIKRYIIHSIISIFPDTETRIYKFDDNGKCIYRSTGGNISSVINVSRFLEIISHTTYGTGYIESVKRVKDNTIFSIGDTVNNMFHDSIIKKFYNISDDNNSLKILSTDNTWNFVNTLTVVKSKENNNEESIILNRECISINELIRELNNNHPILKLNARKRKEIAESLVKLVKRKIQESEKK